MSGTTGTGRRLAGIVSFTLNGIPYDVIDGEWMPDGLTQETMKGLTRVEGYSAVPTQGWMELTLRDGGSFQVRPFIGASGLTACILLANGKTVYGDDMWTVEPSGVALKEATWKLRVEGDNVSELTV